MCCGLGEFLLYDMFRGLLLSDFGGEWNVISTVQRMLMFILFLGGNTISKWNVFPMYQLSFVSPS